MWLEQTVVSGGDRCSEWLEIKRKFEARSGRGLKSLSPTGAGGVREED